MMRMVNGIIACILLTLAIVHAFVPNYTHFVVAYLAGSASALITLKSGIPVPVARMLAVATTAVMFVYFAGFFTMAVHFDEHWHTSSEALEGIGLLLSAFAMIPILSCYSCMLKAECRAALEGEDPVGKPVRLKKRPSFFTAPDAAREESAHP